MSPFEYLSVLISVIVGLGISHLLTIVARLLQERRRVKPFAPTLLWIAILFLLQVQIWWVTYNSRRDTNWNYFNFLLLLAIPVLGFLLSYLVAPHLDDSTDLRTNYYENRVTFFGLVALLLSTSFLRDLLADGIPLDANTAFRVVFMMLTVGAMLVRKDWYHIFNAVVGLGLFCAYVFVEFLRLE